MTRFWGLLRVLGFCFVLGFFVCVVFIFGGFFVCFLGVLFLGFALFLYFFFGGGGEGWFFFSLLMVTTKMRLRLLQSLYFCDYKSHT